jgi:glycosyltransferase involved in cell wall biosynthesis
MFGLFVQKHAKAVSLYCDVKVLYVHANENTNKFETEEKKRGNLTEIIVYYPHKKGKIFYKAFKTINYTRAYFKGYKLIQENKFSPDIVHANILTRTGLVAYILKKCKGIPYVITEHWSRYLPVRNGFNGTFRKLITRLVVKNSEAILPVSKNLENAMKSHKLLNNKYITINNVVDDFFFEDPIPEKRTKKRILHISCFDEQAKNVKGIIRATYELSKIRQDFELILIGTGFDFKSVYDYTQLLDFKKDTVRFLGEKKPEEVAYWLQNSDFFVLFSNYENSPVVIAESLACGKPVISTNVGGISELIDESNGILIAKGNETELTEQMDKMLNTYKNYNSSKIKAESKNKFSLEGVGLQISKIYNQIIE